ncbi:MAG TPA: ATP-binding protein, partial [Anaerolineales bacterium]|nr:ATP-binding protein [Anaerolineales bacterium]
DEVGRLGEAFERMRVRVRSQVDGLSLLLQASISVASSLNLEESLPPILQGALSVTDAEGARLLLMPFDGRQDKLQSYSAGAGAAEMSALGAEILQLVEAEAEIVAIENVARARTVLDVGAGPHSLQAVIALPLQHEANLLGTLWLGYTEPHPFSREESDLLTTLAGQAAVAVANARLFEASEGGRQQLAAILNTTPDAVIVTDSRLRLLLLNPAAKDLFELQGQQITGRRINEMIHQPQLAVALRASDERASAHEIKLPDGRTFSASTSSILRQDGSIIGRLAVLRDVTDFKQLDRQKTDAIAAVSHDLKNPLSLMHGYASMLPMVGQLNARQRDFSEKIVAGVEQMSTLIEDVLDLHRIESAPGSDWERCRLEVLLQQVVEEMRPAAVAKGIQLACAAATGIEPVSGDENLLRRAIRHLLDNGVRYTSAGGSVQARVEMRAEGVVIAVADSGVGISRADQDRLFERFYRVKGQQEGESGGSGLGLAFVKSIAERHGGR